MLKGWFYRNGKGLNTWKYKFELASSCKTTSVWVRYQGFSKSHTCSVGHVIRKLTRRLEEGFFCCVHQANNSQWAEYHYLPIWEATVPLAWFDTRHVVISVPNSRTAHTQMTTDVQAWVIDYIIKHLRFHLLFPLNKIQKQGRKKENKEQTAEKEHFRCCKKLASVHGGATRRHNGAPLQRLLSLRGCFRTEWRIASEKRQCAHERTARCACALWMWVMNSCS